MEQEKRQTVLPGLLMVAGFILILNRFLIHMFHLQDVFCLLELLRQLSFLLLVLRLQLCRKQRPAQFILRAASRDLKTTM